MQPEPVTDPASDFGRRVQSAFFLEDTLVKFLKRLYDTQRLDNQGVNASQPDVVPFDYTQRSQSLEGKIKPLVVRGRIPRTVTGDIALDSLPNVPNVIVQAIKGKVDTVDKVIEKIVTVRLLFTTYDENPDSQGYQDVMNLIEAAEIAFTSFGQQGIDKSFPIVLPIDWSMIEADCHPHFVGEMSTMWRMPAARTLPDLETFGIVPAENIDVHLSAEREGVEDLI